MMQRIARPRARVAVVEDMRALTDTARPRLALDEAAALGLLLAVMAVLESVFLVVRVYPHGAAAYGTLALLVAVTVVATVLIALLPQRVDDRLRNLLQRCSATRARALAVLLAATAVAGVVSVFTQQVYSWDERSVMWSAEVFAEGGVRGLLARYGENAWLGPQHPPLVPLLYGVVTDVLGAHLKLLRLVDLAFGCGTVALAFLIFERLYSRQVAFLAALMLLASPLFVRIASAATNDMPLTFLFCVAILIAQRLECGERARDAVLLGVVIGIGLLVKYTMVLAFPVLLALAWQSGRLAVARRHGPVVLVISCAFLLAWLDHAYALGILGAQSARLGRLASVTMRAPGWSMDAIFTKTPSALGIYLLPLLALGVREAWRRRTFEDGFVLWWIVLVFVPLLLTLPDNRYFLPAFPALMVVVASALVARPRWTVKLLLLALVLSAVSVALYASLDLSQPMFLFREESF